jgi:peptidoglycan/LPS O-acetylase OafA/YrhL
MPALTAPLTMSKDVSANLDFLRAIAVLLVLTQHLCRRMHVEHIAWIPTTSLGLFGVLIFFVHTSLVLMYSMDRSGLHGAPLLKDFYIRRIFRIYPLSILAVVAAVALHLNSDINGIAGLSYGPLPGKLAILSQLLLVQNLVHVKSIVNVLWSLPFEVQMYLFLPFLFVWVKRSGVTRSGVTRSWVKQSWMQRKRIFWSLLGLWAVSLLAAWVQPNVPALGRASLLRFVPCFLPGIIAFAGPRVPRLRSYLWPIFILGLVCAFSLYPVLPMGWMLCLILGIFIPFFREIQSRSIRFISHRIATYSYGIYISHQFCIWFALGVLAAQPLWLRVAVLSTSLVLVPILLYYGIEKPMILAGIRVATRLRDKPTAAVVVAA